MRSSFVIVLVATILFSGALWYVRTEAVCPAPLSYRLGAYDERFLLSKERVIDILKEADAAWEESLGRDLFTYDESSDFVIDFVFDERQRRAVGAELTREELDEQSKKTDEIREDIDRLTGEYDALRGKYETRVRTYEERLGRHNKEVETRNQAGGVSESEQAKFAAEAKSLRKEQGSLEGMARDLNDLVTVLNQLRDEGNALVAAYNDGVVVYNDHYGEAGAFTQGEFSGDRITIYKYTDETELRQVVAHELGHALGAGHVENPIAIMYHMLEEQPDGLVIQSEDEEVLRAVCGDGDEWSHRLRRGIRTALSLFN